MNEDTKQLLIVAVGLLALVAMMIVSIQYNADQRRLFTEKCIKTGATPLECSSAAATR